MRGSPIPYSNAEMRWLEENRTLVISDYHAAFCAAFGRSDVSAAHLHYLRKRKGWKVGRAKGRTAGRHWKFSAAEIAWLRDNRTREIGDYHKSFCVTFNRTDISADALHSMRKRMHWRTGRTGHFAKGAVPWSKGKKLGNNPGSARTQFKKGVSPRNTKYLGHERVDTSGYIHISVDQINPHTGFERRYVLKHKWLWEQKYGPVPEGMVLKCKGDRRNTDPSNWELVPRGVLPRLNGISGRGYDDAPAELKPTIMAVSKLEQRLYERRKLG